MNNDRRWPRNRNSRLAALLEGDGIGAIFGGFNETYTVGSLKLSSLPPGFRYTVEIDERFLPSEQSPIPLGVVAARLLRDFLAIGNASYTYRFEQHPAEINALVKALLSLLDYRVTENAVGIQFSAMDAQIASPLYTHKSGVFTTNLADLALAIKLPAERMVELAKLPPNTVYVALTNESASTGFGSASHTPQRTLRRLPEGYYLFDNIGVSGRYAAEPVTVDAELLLGPVKSRATLLESTPYSALVQLAPVPAPNGDLCANCPWREGATNSLQPTCLTANQWMEVLRSNADVACVEHEGHACAGIPSARLKLNIEQKHSPGLRLKTPAAHMTETPEKTIKRRSAYSRYDR